MAMMVTPPTNEERPVTGVDILGRPAKAWTGCHVLMTYMKPDGTICMNRRVEHILFKATKDGHWTMVGADVESKQPRSFRVDRIINLTVVEEPVTTEQKNETINRTEAA